MSESTAAIKAELTAKTDQFKSAFQQAAEKIAKFEAKIKDLSLISDKYNIQIQQAADKINKYKQKIADVTDKLNKQKISQEKAAEITKKYEQAIQATSHKQDLLKNKLTQTTNKINDFNRKIKETEASAKKAGSPITKLIDSFNKFKTAIAAIAGAFIVFAVLKQVIQSTVNFIISYVNKGIEYTKTVIKAMRLMGESVKHTSQIVALAEYYNIPVEALARGLTKLTIASQLNSKVLQKYNIETKDSHGNQLKTLPLLENVAKKYKELGGGLRGAAMAQQLLGRTGQQLIPILSKGQDGIKEFAKEIEDLGLILPESYVKQVKDYIEATKGLKLAFKGLDILISEAFLPMVLPILQGFRKLIRDFVSWIRKSGIIEGIKVFAFAVGKTFALVMDIFTSYLNGILQVAQTIVQGLFDIVNALTGNSIKVVNIGEFLKNYLLLFLAFLMTAKNIIIAIFNALVSTIKSGIYFIIGLIRSFINFLNQVKNFIVNVLNAILQAFRICFYGIAAPINAAMEIIERLIKKLTKLINKMIMTAFTAKEMGKKITEGIGAAIGMNIPGLGFLGGWVGKLIGGKVANSGQGFLDEYLKLKQQLEGILNGDSSDNSPDPIKTPINNIEKNTGSINNTVEEIAKQIRARNFIKAMEQAYNARNELAEAAYKISQTGKSIGNRITNHGRNSIEPIVTINLSIGGFKTLTYTGKKSKAEEWLKRTLEYFNSIGAPKPRVIEGY